MAEIAVAGQPVLIMMTEGQPTAEVLASLRFEIHRVPARAGAALRLPYYAPTLPPGRYYIDKVSTKVGLLVTASAADLTASQRTDLAWFGDAKQSPAARHYYFVAADAQTVAANEDPALDPYALAGPTGIVVWQLEHFLARTRPLPDDPLAWLSRQPYLHVIRPAHEERVGASQARVVDVRANAAIGGIPCPDGRGHCAMPFAHIADAFPIVISSEYVTRFVDLAVGSQHIIVAADLGTPGASLLSSLCAFRLDKPVAGPPCG